MRGKSILSLASASALALVLFTAACSKNKEAPAEGTPAGKTAGQQETGPAPAPAPTPAPATADGSAAAPAAAPAPAPAADGSAAAPAAGAPAPAGDPVAEAKQLFATLCVTCHGASGKGDGQAAASLNPKPRDYSDAAWQKSVKDEDIAKAIVEGGPGIGKSPLMPPNPSLKDKPQVVAELVKMIRAFAK